MEKENFSEENSLGEENSNVQEPNSFEFQQALKFFKKKWKTSLIQFSKFSVLTITSIGFVLFLISKRKSKIQDQIVQNVRKTLKLPVNPDPRWKVYRSFIQDHEKPLKSTSG
jgi:hypothetical protein